MGEEGETMGVVAGAGVERHENLFVVGKEHSISVVEVETGSELGMSISVVEVETGSELGVWE